MEIMLAKSTFEMKNNLFKNFMEEKKRIVQSNNLIAAPGT